MVAIGSTTGRQGRGPAVRGPAAAGLCAGALAAALAAATIRPEPSTAEAVYPPPPEPVPAETVAAMDTADAALDPMDTAEKLIDAIILVESGGDSARVGAAGERGLMQIRRGTWKAVTARRYGRPLPFRWAFHPEWNRRVGRAYLAELHDRLLAARPRWRTDERTLLLAAYNAGPSRVAAAGYDPSRLPATTRDYARRVAHLHDEALAEAAEPFRSRLLAQAPSATAGDLPL